MLGGPPVSTCMRSTLNPVIAATASAAEHAVAFSEPQTTFSRLPQGAWAARRGVEACGSSMPKSHEFGLLGGLCCAGPFEVMHSLRRWVSHAAARAEVAPGLWHNCCACHAVVPALLYCLAVHCMWFG